MIVIVDNGENISHWTTRAERHYLVGNDDIFIVMVIVIYDKILFQVKNKDFISWYLTSLMSRAAWQPKLDFFPTLPNLVTHQSATSTDI